MTQDEIIEMANEAGIIQPQNVIKTLEAFAKLVAQHEREACIALHDHEDVLAPIGASAWGEAHQTGWIEGTAAYREAIRARGQA
jgi:membrane carboxypeptidase/penicillin-binding protein PbpC